MQVPSIWAKASVFGDVSVIWHDMMEGVIKVIIITM